MISYLLSELALLAPSNIEIIFFHTIFKGLNELYIFYAKVLVILLDNSQLRKLENKSFCQIKK